MSEQILLQGKILGIEEFLLSPPGGAAPARSNGEELLAGRSQWITLLCNISQVSGLRNRFHVSSVEGPIGNTPGGFRKAVKPPEVSVPPKKQRFPAGKRCFL